MKVNVELAIFFALLLVIAGTFLVLQETSITGAAITTLPAEETTLVEMNESSSEQTVEVKNETYAEPEMPKEEKQNIGIQEITIQNAPSITLVLNTTNVSTNSTDVNLTAYNTTQTDGNSLKVIYNWLMNNTPIAVLNMPFEGINGTAYNNSRDYSGLGNHGNESGGIVWNASGGYDGKGAYMFDGINDYIDLADRDYFKSSLCINGCTFSAWAYKRDATSSVVILSRNDATGNDRMFRIGVDSNEKVDFTITSNGSFVSAENCAANSATGQFLINVWQHVTGRYNLTHTALFINGTQVGATACPFPGINVSKWDESEKTFIGAREDNIPTQFWNGTIDEVTIFNRSLSKEQIYALWRNQTNVIVAQETNRGENWTVHATPNNGTGDGAVVISNNVTILNAKPVISPLVLNTTNLARNDTDVNLTAYANTSDIDIGDSVKVIYNWLLNQQSITVLNMPFEGINGTDYNNTWDYSGFGNNGNRINTTWNATGGYDGKGAYQFNATNGAFIDIADTASLDINGSLTLAAWIKPLSRPQLQVILWHGSGGVDYMIRRFATGELGGFVQNSSNTQLIVNTTSSITENVWQHVAVTYDLDNNNLSIYIDGVLNNSKVQPGQGKIRDTGRFEIGNFFPTHTQPFNGTIDEVMVWNRTLSKEQIYALWRNQTDVIVAQETSLGENWTVQATPNDGYDDGAMVTSTNITILDKTVPTVNITSPANGSNFSIITTLFNATVSDSESSISAVIFIFNNRTNPFNLTASNSSGTWNVTINTSTLAEGLQGVAVFANDSYNNINYTQFINFTVDRTPPNVTRNFLNNPVDNSNFSIRSSNQTFNASVFDNLTQVDTVYFWFDNGTSADVNATATNRSGQWVVSYNVSTLAEGKQGVRIIANDTLNNINNSAVINFTVDYTGPTITMLSPAVNTYFGYDVVNFNASVSDALLQVGFVYFEFLNGTNPFNVTAYNISGNWNASVNLSRIAEGRQTLIPRANDTVGNDAELTTFDIFIDRTPPNVTINYNFVDNSNFSIRSSNQTFNVSLFDPNTFPSGVNASYFWFDNGTGNDFNVTAVNQSGEWVASYNVSTLAEGKQGVRIIANDSVKNINNTFVINFTIDFTSPNITSNFVNNPVDNSNFSIRSSNQTFNASVFDNLLLVDTVYFWFDNGTSADVNATATNSSGQWTVSYNVSTLAEGKQGVRIMANDTVNNINNSAVINFTIDFTPPNITRNFLNNPVDNSNFSIRSSNQTFNASIFDNLLLVDTVYFWFDNGTSADINITGINNSGQWTVSYNVSTLAEGKQGVRIMANDTVNNINNSAVINFTIDFTPPNITRNFLNNPVDNSNFSIRSSNQTFNASVFDNLLLVDTVYFWFDNGTSADVNATATNSSGQWTVSYNVSTLAEGKQGVRIMANDTANNINNSAVINFTVDFTAPAVNITGPAAGATVIGTRAFNATINDALLEISTVIFQFSNTTPFNRTASNSSGSWNISVDTTTIAEGALTVTIFANDTVGNLNNTQTLSLTVDNVAEAGAGAGSGGGGGSSGGSVSGPSKPIAEYVCGNGVLENGESCDSGDGCTSECKCGDGYNSVKEIDCEKVPDKGKENYCGDGIVNQAIEECDGTDFNQRTCVTEEYVEGELTCDPQCVIETTKCLVKKSDEGKETTFAKSKALAGKAFFFVENYTDIVQQFPFYLLLTAVLILVIIAGLHIKDMPVPEFLWRFRPAPEVKVEEPAVITSPSTIEKTDLHLRDWGKKNYLDLQQELKRVEALIKEMPLPEQKNKALKLTSIKKESLQTQNGMQEASINQRKISPEEVERWVTHLYASGTPSNKVMPIVKKSTSLSEAEIKPILVKVRATQLLEKTYSLNQKAIMELRDFIRTERKNGATIEQIIADLVQEGWDETIIRLYVSAHYA